MEGVIDPATVRVKDVIEEVYREAGRGNDDSRGSKNDPDSRNSLETIAWRKAYRHLGVHDRIVVGDAMRTLREKMGTRDDAALSILMRLGVYLLRCEGK